MDETKFFYLKNSFILNGFKMCEISLEWRKNCYLFPKKSQKLSQQLEATSQPLMYRAVRDALMYSVYQLDTFLNNKISALLLFSSDLLAKAW